MSTRWEKSKRVTWAPDGSLTQVKMFLPEDCPSQVGIDSGNRLQAKTLKVLPHGVGFDDPPPGFEGNMVSNTLKKEHPFPRIRWKCPPKFVLDNNWYVAAGEESEECVTQPIREIRVLEAIYPRPSAIPPSPCVSLEVEQCEYDDRYTPVISIIPIEEEDALDGIEKVEMPAATITIANSARPIAEETAARTEDPSLEKPCADKELPLGMLAGLDADIIAAASAAFTALMKSNEQESIIDTDLLIKILSEPKMIELLKDAGSLNGGRTAAGPSIAASAAVTAVRKNSEHGSMIDTDLLINILSEPKLIELLKDVGSCDREKTAPGFTASNMPFSGLKQAIPQESMVPKTLQAASSVIPMHVPERASTIPLSRMQLQKFLYTKPANEKPNKLPSVVPITTSICTATDTPAGIPLLPLSPTPDICVLEKPATEKLGIPLKQAQLLPNTNGSNISADKPDKLPLQKSSSSIPTAYLDSRMYRSKPMMPTGTSAMPQGVSITPKVNLDSAACNMTFNFGPMSTKGVDAVSSRATNGSLHSGWHGSCSSPSLTNIVPLPAQKVQAFKDMDYYKSLIKQHGTERQETGIGHGSIQQNDHRNLKDFDFVVNPGQGDVRPKSGKACIYFNSSRGCRNGSNCPYRHNSPILLQTGSAEERSMKRIKLSRGITGRT